MKTTRFGGALALAGVLALSGAAFAQDPAPAAGAEATTPARPTRTISVDFRDMPIRDALDTLFRGTGFNFALTPEAAQAAPTVTLSLQDVTFDVALRTLTQTAGLRSRRDRETSVYILEARGADVTQAQPTGAAPPVDTAPAPDVVTPLEMQKIPLNFVDSIDIYGVLTGQGSNRARNSGGLGGGGGSSFGGGGSSFGGGGSSFGGGGGGFGGGGSSFGGGGSSFGGGGGGFGGGGGSFGGGGFGGGGGGFGR